MVGMYECVRSTDAFRRESTTVRYGEGEYRQPEHSVDGFLSRAIYLERSSLCFSSRRGDDYSLFGIRTSASYSSRENLERGLFGCCAEAFPPFGGFARPTVLFHASI